MSVVQWRAAHGANAQFLCEAKHFTMKSSTSLKGNENCVLEQYLRPDAVNFCNQNTGEILTFWLALKLDTSVSNEMEIPDVMVALATVEAILCNTKHYWQRRLAYIQLRRILDSLEEMMRFQSNHKPGSSQEALRTYAKALGQSGVGHVAHRKRLSLRWSLCTGDSLFLAVAYSDYAEVMV